MTNQDFIDYLLSVIEDKEISFTDSILDKSKEKTICVYQTSNVTLPRSDGYKILPVTIIIIYGKNGYKAQKFVQDLFQNSLYRQKLINEQFYIDIKTSPKFLGRTETGCFEYAIDCKLIY